MSSWALLDGTEFAELGIDAVRGAPGVGFYRLMCQVKVSTRPREEDRVVVTDIEAELWMMGADRKKHCIGVLDQRGRRIPVETYGYSHPMQVGLELELDGTRLEAIERLRLGGKVKFSLDVMGLAHLADGRIVPVRAKLDYEVPQSRWVEILEEMGYRRTMLLEIPMPAREESASLEKVAEHLQSARQHLLNGRFRDAVAACRDVLESLAAELHDEEEMKNVSFARLPGKNKQERLRVLRKALISLAHAAKHSDSAAASIEWNYLDAQCMVIMAASVVRMVFGEKRRVG